MKKITRRQALGTTAGALTVLGLSTAVNGVSTSAAAVPSPAAPAGTVDEVYQGRRIQITPGSGGHHGGHHAPGLPTVRIDGRELHVMRNADGSWISVVNHYETYPDPVLLARAAVRDLQGAALVPFGGAA
ncbi:tyrosinase cofactor [Streptomyces sp. NPDC016562]|uniref:apotyrosinase chaperone MelC1 n=1 Tax=Streptomyces sp. NPDC016562 TaxID=3364966 RepID=UPI0036F5E8D9